MSYLNNIGFNYIASGIHNIIYAAFVRHFFGSGFLCLYYGIVNFVITFNFYQLICSVRHFGQEIQDILRKIVDLPDGKVENI